MQPHEPPSTIGGSPPTRAGLVALVGFPNAGKSSLLNRLLDQKLSIVTPRAQTTRERVVGIDTRDGAQMVFVDTPGLVDPSYLLQHAMRQAALDAIPEADVVVYVLDAASAPPPLDEEAGKRLRQRGTAVLVALNKMDIATEAESARARSWAAKTLDAPLLELSATSGEGVAELRGAIAARLPESPYLYPEDEISSQPVRFFVEELVRETAFDLYREEIPYSLTAKVEEFREASDPVYIRATLFVERPSQKGIVLGEKGAGIRELGTASRGKIEEFLGRRVFLDLWVKVLPRWRRDAAALQRLGFTVPSTES
jgi:GTPase